MIGWVAVGFIPTYAALEVGTRELAKRMSAELLQNLDSRSNKKTESEVKINGL